MTDLGAQSADSADVRTVRDTINRVRLALRDEAPKAEREGAMDALEELRATGGVLMRWVKADRERGRAVDALQHILLGSLLDVRRAAFTPQIGCRYTEAIRLDIASELRRLEDVARDAVSGVGS